MSECVSGLDSDRAPQTSGTSTEAREDQAFKRARRCYLTQRRHELLAAAGAIVELAALLADETEICASPLATGNLKTITQSAQRMAAMIGEALGPASSAEDAARALNHDLRSPLTAVIGFSDDLRRVASKHGLEHFALEFDQLHSLGQRMLSLLTGAVTHLRSPDGCSPIDGLQRYLARASSRGIHQPCAAGPAPEPGKIIVAEDDANLRDLLCDYLRAQGHEVVSARDGVEALEIIRSRSFDLLLTDVEMPRANGYELLERVGADPNLCSIPVIVVSGHGELEGIAHCISMGAEDYLPKPFNRVILSARVNASLEKKRLRERTEQQRKQYDELLHAILPAPVVSELAQSKTVRPRRHDQVAVLFADIVGFTPYCDRHRDEPELVVLHLRRMFEAWEEIAVARGVQKIKTIGDAFMAVSGLLEERTNPVLDCVCFSLDVIRFTQDLCDEAGRPLGFNLRVGIHKGPVVAGVLGRRQSLYDLWGDTVNTAARLESHGKSGCINLSSLAWSSIAGCVSGETRGTCCLKGKSAPMEVVYLDPAHVTIQAE
jgi:class 3 adenylate cyclase